jgi:hypothetical protein
MAYRLRLHSEIRDWVADLLATEPELARLVGEACVALLDGGERLGPPLVVPLESALEPPDDPREALDLSYMRQLEALQTVRRGVADVATSRYRIELQIKQLEESAAKLVQQSRDAFDLGKDDQVRAAQARGAGVQEQLSRLRTQHSALKEQEERLTAASQRLQAWVDAFRTRKEALKATFTAAEASLTIREAFARLGDEVGVLGLPESEAEDPFWPGSELPEASEVLAEMADLLGTEVGSGPADDADVPVPPGVMELRVGAPDEAEVGLLFVMEPEDTAVLVAMVEDPGGPPWTYRRLMPAVVARLAEARSAPSSSEGSPARFHSYNAASFLDEFFPGAATEVEIGAAALAARIRACTLAQARERIGMTQEQVAQRMDVHSARVAAIERAEPGATEVRTLAAYVQALGGRLEIIADLGEERVMLR